MHNRGIVSKPKNISKTLKELMTYFKNYKMSLAIVFIFSIASTLFIIVGPKIMAKATNTIVDGYVEQKTYDNVIKNIPDGIPLDKINGADLIKNMPDKDKLSDDQKKIITNMDFTKRPKMNFSKIIEIINICIVIYALSAIFDYIQSFIIAIISQKVTYKLRDKIFKKINFIPLKYYDKNNNGDILSRITNDVDTLGHTITMNLSHAVSLITGVIGIIIMMISINPLMTLIAMLTLPLSVIFIKFVTTYSQKYFKAQQEKLGIVNSHIEENYAGANIVKAFNNEDITIKCFNEANNELCDCAFKSQFYSGIMMPIVNFVGNIGYVGVCVLGGYLVAKNRISVGDVQAFIQYLRTFNQDTSQVASTVSSFQTTLAACERIFDFLAVDEEVKDRKNAVTKNVSGNVKFENVKFGYDEDKIIINNLNLDIKKGQKVAIVGPTGAGKTTLVKLLMRFYDINSGKILIDNIDIKDYKRGSLRNNFGMVLQDTWLFNGTILDNIKYGNNKANLDDIKEAAKKARVDHFVSTLPGGYNYVLNEEGSNISAGEKQLLTIARAILADPKILILDEATSNVDTRTEILINEAMQNLMKDKTSFIIAHRLSTIRNADLIIVMDKGDIVETGNHNELIAKNGFYAKLYNSQFETGE